MLKAADRKEIEQWIEDQVAKILPDEVKKMCEVPDVIQKDNFKR